MIVSAGLTPAWQHILVFETFRRSGVNRAVDVHWCGSGKALNVGIALARLGGQCMIVSVLGGPAREAIEREMDELVIPSRWITALAPTRTCTTIIDTANGDATELVENAAALSEQELEDFQRVFVVEATRAEVVVLTGSLPVGTPPTLYRDLLRQIQSRAVLDVCGEELLAALEQKPLLVKPNRDELAHTMGRSLADDAELRRAMQELHDRGAQWVVVSDGQRAIWITDGTKFHRIVPPKPQKVVNPIGCGDCLAAGIAWALRAGREPLDAVRFGVAAAADNLSELLPGRIDPARVAERVTSIAVEIG